MWRGRTVLMGAASSGARPTAAELRIAAALAVIAVAWMAACAVIGAALVGP